MSSNSALIVGVSGQTGSYLAKNLLSHDVRVVGTTRDLDHSNMWRLKRLGIYNEVLVKPVSPHDFRSVYTALRDVRPDYIFFLGGQSSVGLSFKQPFETFESISVPVLNILESMRLLELDCRFINSASTDMFGNQPGALITEEAPMRPVSPYGVAKMASFWTTVQYREAFGLHANNAILSNHESPLRGSQFVTRKIVSQLSELADGSRSSLEFGNVSILRDWLWAGDVADALREIAKLPEPSDVIVASGQSHSLLELMTIAADEMLLDIENLLHVTQDELRPSEISSIQLDPQKLKSLTGWAPSLTFEEMVRRLVLDRV